MYKRYRGNGFEVVSVAIDLQGAERAGPWVEKAGASFPALVDREATLGAMFGLNYVPFSFLVDETGRMVRGPQPTNVEDDSQRGEIVAWIEKGSEQVNVGKRAKMAEAAAFADPETRLRFSRAALLLELGKARDATIQLRRALTRDPDNWLIHKQIWSIEHPERFYDGPVDFPWQRTQLEHERRAGESGDS